MMDELCGCTEHNNGNFFHKNQMKIHVNVVKTMTICGFCPIKITAEQENVDKTSNQHLCYDKTVLCLFIL
jgi:hypothetical protein